MNRLKELRFQKNLRQQDIAEYLSVAKSTYSYWESGKIEINNENLFRLADFFNVSVDYLLGRTDIRKTSASAEDDVKIALFGGDGEVTPEMWEEARNYAQYLKEKQSKKKEEQN